MNDDDLTAWARSINAQLAPMTPSQIADIAAIRAEIRAEVRARRAAEQADRQTSPTGDAAAS